MLKYGSFTVLCRAFVTSIDYEAGFPNTIIWHSTIKHATVGLIGSQEVFIDSGHDLK